MECTYRYVEVGLSVIRRERRAQLSVKPGQTKMGWFICDCSKGCNDNTNCFLRQRMKIMNGINIYPNCLGCGASSKVEFVSQWSGLCRKCMNTKYHVDEVNINADNM